MIGGVRASVGVGRVGVRLKKGTVKINRRERAETREAKGEIGRRGRRSRKGRMGRVKEKVP